MRTTPSVPKLGMGTEGIEDRARRSRPVNPESTAQNSCHFLRDLQPPASWMKISDLSFLKSLPKIPKRAKPYDFWNFYNWPGRTNMLNWMNKWKQVFALCRAFSVKYIEKESLDREKERDRERERLSDDELKVYSKAYWVWNCLILLGGVELCSSCVETRI